MAIGKHGSEEFRELAEAGTILRVQVGSGVLGTAIAGTDDRDEMGICIEPPEYVIGLRYFEQYENHTAWQRADSLRARSGPGDLDINIYSLRKYLRLALDGNPSILTVLFTPEKDIVTSTPLGRELLAMTPSIVSKSAGPKYLGYLMAQRTRMLSRDGKGKDVTRPELIEKYGFDTKYAGHMLRLGLQGIELMETGRLTLPLPPDDRQLVREIRTGRYTMQEALKMAEDTEERLKDAIRNSELPERPDREALDPWLVRAYTKTWG